MILGQFEAGNGKPGYLEDDSIAEKDRESLGTPPSEAVRASKGHFGRILRVGFGEIRMEELILVLSLDVYNHLLPY